ncbi:integral membrane protein [Rutstroemia sp. NJR-2017a BBW]|nr:integral membrane protein [Rutstroemia sp. NJR-2017a BBW]
MSSISSSLTNAPPDVLLMLNSTPAIPPPDGVSPNFEHPQSRGQLQITVTSVILSIMLLFFINRVYVKVFLIKKARWDDGAYERWSFSWITADQLVIGTLLLGVVMTLAPIYIIVQLTDATQLGRAFSYCTYKFSAKYDGFEFVPGWAWL